MQRSTLFIALLTITHLALAAPWTYRGTLNDGGKPANGEYDLRLTLVNEAGTQSITQPMTLMGVTVKDGHFAAEVDFGIDLNNGPAMKLKTEVAQGGSGFMVLGEPTRFDAKAALGGVCWDTTGNSVTAGEFLGSTNNAALEFRVGNEKVFSIAPSAASGIVNVVAGSSGNATRAGILGATVFGGGGVDFSNFVFESYGTVAGGRFNTAGDVLTPIGRISAATVSGGSSNYAVGLYSTVPGGFQNRAIGDYSFAAGARAQVESSAPGSFVWSDDQPGTFTSSNPRQFLIRAQGGMGINTTALGNAVGLRASELVVRNGVIADNTDITLMNDTNRGYNLVSVPNGVNAGTFAIGEVDARTANVGFTNRLLIAPNGDVSVSANAFKPGGGAWAVSSDARLKRDVSTLSGSLDRLLALRGVNFSYRIDGPKALTAPGSQIGFIAQEVEKVFPQWIGEKEGYKTVGITGFEALTVEALRELRFESALIDQAQRAELDQLRDENTALRQSDAELRTELLALKQAVEALQVQGSR